MLIRTEIAVDAAGIHTLLRRCFASPATAELVSKLREDGLLTLGMVATDDEGQVLGYTAFSPVQQKGVDNQWVALAPLAVDERVRLRGIGRQLVFAGLETLKEFGYAAVVVLGSPAFYSRFGFEPGTRYDLHCTWPQSETALHVYKLTDRDFSDISGGVEYASHFRSFHC